MDRFQRTLPIRLLPKRLAELIPLCFALAHGTTDFFDGWMKDSRSALISCNDGFRPVSFLLEVMEEKA